MTWAQVGAWRMARHHLVERAPRSALLDVVSDICGLHAQLSSSAELTAWARVADLEPDAIATALGDDRSLVKSWAMRGTLHLLPSSEYGLWLGGLSTYQHYLKPAWSTGFGISQDELKRMIAAVARALDGRSLTREELAAEVGRRTKSPALADKLLGSWGSTLKPATYQGKLCFGPTKGRNVTFVRPDQWLKKLQVTPGDEAMATITRRYLHVNGPATRDDYARWFAISPAAAGKHIAALDDDVAEVDVDGTPMSMLAADVDAAQTTCKPARAVRLVPAFDQYVVASTRQADNLLPGPHRARVYRPQGWLSPVVLVDGQMAGVWKHERKGARLTVAIEPFATLPKWAGKAAEAEAAALGRFLGAEPEVTWA
ncbi:MAG: hypothetical protein QOG82_1614 [Actinomycetota bacterium]|nr:hypothetical protein [Actinomycetota bacterium]